MAGRHRHLRRTGFLVTAAVAAVPLVAGGAWAGYRGFSGDAECATTVQLRVAAATEIAPAVRASADAWMRRDDARAGGRCVTVEVTAADPSTVTAAIGARHGVRLSGVATGRPATADTDIWVPDSSTWLLRLASEAPGFVPTLLGSIAQSPVVLAVPGSPAGAPARTAAMRGLLARIATDKKLRPAIVDPAHDATGLAGLVAVAGSAGTGSSAAALKVGVMRALSANSADSRRDLLGALGTRAGMALLSEADVITHNGGAPAVKLAAVYPQPSSVALDYPYALMPGIDPQKVTAATALREALGSDTFRGGLAVAGIRGPDGTAGAGFAPPPGAPVAVAPPSAPRDLKAAAGAVGQLLGSWTAITQPGRMLAVFDVSGSMKAKVPTAGGLTRAQVTQAVARQGLALLDDRWSVGNWTFSTNMAGRRPWVENMPISSCATHRRQLEAAIGRIVPKDDGDTGLYDTALAAYQRMRDSWRPGVSNSVVIYTDGKNDNPGGMTIDELIRRMTRLRDPHRPIRMIIIGMGTTIDRAELEAIATASGSGGVFIATDPAKIGEIFLEAIASRQGA